MGSILWSLNASVDLTWSVYEHTCIMILQEPSCSASTRGLLIGCSARWSRLSALDKQVRSFDAYF